MKTAIRYAGLFASGTFVLLTYAAFFTSYQPLKVFYLAIPGALIAGVLGYQIGDILSHPKRRKPPRKKTLLPPEPAMTVSGAESSETRT